MKLNITSRLAIVLMLFAAGLLFAVTLLYYNFAQRSLRESTSAELTSIASEKLAQLNLILNERSRLLDSLAKSPDITNPLQGATQNPNSQALLQEALATRLETGGPFAKLSILGAADGKVIASTSPVDVGKTINAQPFFTNGLKDIYVQVAYQNAPGDEPRTVISAPMRDKDGNTLGVLVGWMPMDDLNEIISQRAQHQSVETYLVDKSRLFLTQPMLAEEPLQLLKTDYSNAAGECLNGLTGVTFGNDYRGTPSLFAYVPSPYYRLCLITKINLAEALDPINRLTVATVAISSATMLAAILLAFVLARTFTRPILALQKGAERFGQGDLTTRIPVESSDELGMLATSFNAMASAIAEQKAQLEQQNIDLEHQVAERTSELRKSEEELRALFAAMQDVVAVMDSEGRYVSSPPTGNRRMYTFLKLAIGKRLHDVFPTVIADDGLAKIHEALRTKSVIEFEHVLPVGRRVRSFLSTISPLTENTVIWVAHDITQSVRTRNALARNEALNQAIIEHSPVGIAIRDAEARLLYGNQAWCEIRGLGLDQIREAEQPYQGQGLVEYSVYHSNNAWQVMEIYKKGGALFIPEVETGEKNPGAAQWVSLYCYGIVNDAGQVESVVTLTQDITARKERERELQALISLSSVLRVLVTRDEMLPFILDQLQQLLKVDAAGIVLRSSTNPELLAGSGVGEWSNWEKAPAQPADTGIAGRILSTAQPYVSQDVHSDPDLWGEYVGRVKALAAVPLIAREQAIGILVVGSLVDIPRSSLRIVSAFGEIAANALYRSILHDQTERRLQWLTAIRSIDQAITNSLDLHTTLNIVLEKAVTHLNVAAADILLLHEGNRLIYAAGRGFKSTLASKANLMVGQPQAGIAVLERKTVLISDYECASGWNCDLMKQEGFKGYCTVPLIAKGQLKGVIEVFHRQTLNVDTEWMEFLESLAGQAAISIDNAAMLETIQKTNVEMTVAYDVTLEGWSVIVDRRCREAPGHTERIANMTLRLAQEIGIDERQLIHIRRGALMHNVGTILIPEKILYKTGALTPREKEIVEQHPIHSNEMLSSIHFLRPALEIPYYHHEHWDGSGYPRGLRGESIPLAARVFAVAEAWEDLTHDHPGRPALSKDEALSHIAEESGRRFDPRVVESFRKVIARG